MLCALTSCPWRTRLCAATIWYKSTYTHIYMHIYIKGQMAVVEADLATAKGQMAVVEAELAAAKGRGLK